MAEKHSTESLPALPVVDHGKGSSDIKPRMKR